MAKPAPPPAAPAKAARAYRGVNNEQRVAERRARFLAAATECFGTRGFHHTTLKMLCAEAGLTERYFYESFRNFDDILCAAYEHAAEALTTQVAAAVARSGDSVDARMLAMLDAYYKGISQDKARARLLLIEIEGASEQANATYLRRLELSTDLIEHVACAGLPAKPANGLAPRLLASTILGALYHVAKVWAHAGFKPARATIVRNVHATAMGTVAAWTSPAGKNE